MLGNDAVGLACQIPQGNLNAGNTAALAGMEAELLDFMEQPVDVAGIFAGQSAFQHCGIGFAGCVPNLAVALDA